MQLLYQIGEIGLQMCWRTAPWHLVDARCGILPQLLKAFPKQVFMHQGKQAGYYAASKDSFHGGWLNLI
ncbi:hypothetical protein [Desulfobulbus propionicus]|jgi:hypothetical protein